MYKFKNMCKMHNLLTERGRANFIKKNYYIKDNIQ